MGSLGDLVVRIVGDTAQFDSALGKSEKKVKSFEDKAKAMAKTLTDAGKKLSTFVTLPILGIGAAFVKSAADAEEVNSKFNIVFRDQAESVREWAREFGDATGRSTIENIKFLASVQDLFVPLGVARDEAADLSKSVVTLATDMASFNNLPTADVIRDIQSSLVGNHETVRKYGVVLSEVTVNQELLNIGIEGGYKEATAAEKALARLNLIMAGTTDAQGDAIRTSESFTNRFIALKSSIIDLSQSFGNLLLPTIQKLVEGVTKAVKFVDGLDESQKKMIITIAGLVAAIGPAILIIGKSITVFLALKKAILAMNLAMLASPWAIAVYAAVGLGLAIWGLVEASKAHKEEQIGAIELSGEMAKQTRDETEAIYGQNVARQASLVVTAKAIQAKMEERVAEQEARVEATKSAQVKAIALGILGMYQTTLKEATEKVNKYTEGLTEARGQLAEHIEGTKRLADEQARLTAGTEKTTKSFDELAVIARTKIRKEFLEIEERAKAFGDEIDVVAEKKRTLRMAIEDLISKGFQVEWASIQQLIEQYEELGKTEISTVEEAYAARKEYWDSRIRMINVIQDAKKAAYAAEVAAAKEAAEKEAAADKVAAEEIKRTREQLYDAIVSMVTSVAASIGQIWANQHAAEMALLEEKYDNLSQAEIDYNAFLEEKEKERYDSLSEAEKAEYDLRVAAEEAERARLEALETEKKRLIYDEAVRQRDLALFQVFINTLSAVIKMLADPGGLPGVALSIAAGIAGAANAIAIASKPLPALARGGIIREPTVLLAGEAGPERITPLGEEQPIIIGISIDGRALDATITRNVGNRRILIAKEAVV